MSIYKGDSLIAGGRQCMPLLSFMWADHRLNHPSWLNSTTFSWQSGAVYQAAYQHLVNDLPEGFYGIVLQHDGTYYRYADGDVTGDRNPYCWSNGTSVYFTRQETPSVGDYVYQSSYATQTEDTIISVGNVLPTPETETIAGVTVSFYRADDGHKICPASEESNVTAIYNATGVAWYYIIDTTNQRFKLPRTKFGFTGIRSGVGNYVEAGLPNITGNTHWIGAVLNNNNTSYANGVFSAFDTNNGAYAGGGGYGNAAGRLNFDASRSSSVYGSSSTVQPKATEMYLYFYVGNFTQTALENTAGLNAELFNGKADLSTVAHVVTEFQEPTAANNYTWYRKYADGWVEQGGQFTNTSRLTTINLPITMANNGYVINVTQAADSGYTSSTSIGVQTGSITTTGFQALNWYNNTYTSGLLNWWHVSGMAAN